MIEPNTGIIVGGNAVKDNLLFVSRDPAVIQEFLDAVKDYEFEADTADSGQQAAKMLQEKKYKVVITGMNLSSFDGNKLIAWLNEKYPETICIVYTTRVDLAQLRLLVNERNVFRIFLKPANYHGDFYHAVMDGFAYYDILAAQKEKQDLLEKKRENAVHTITEMEEAARVGEEERQKLEQFLFPLIQLSIQEFGPEIPKKEIRELLIQEEKIMKFYLRKNYKPCHSIEEIQKRLQQEFIGVPEKQRICLSVKKSPGKMKPGFFESLHFLLWLVMHQIAEISGEYSMGIEIDFSSPAKTAVRMEGTIPKGALERYREQPGGTFLLKMTGIIADNMSDQCRWEFCDGQISGEMEWKPQIEI